MVSCHGIYFRALVVILASRMLLGTTVEYELLDWMSANNLLGTIRLDCFGCE